MPLLGKELTEQAARRRTYVLRVVYATLLCAMFLLSSYQYFAPRYSGWQSFLGAGRQMLETLINAQFVGIFIFLPAMMSQTIVEEKEKESLALLFLTDMGPWELLWQKYLGRLIPMFSLLLLAVPLMAIAYSFGGFTTDYLLSGVWLLFLACLQAGAFALMCSAFCRTAVGAFMLSYLGGAAFYLSPVIVWWLLKLVGIDGRLSDESFNHFPPAVFYFRGGQRSFSAALGHSIPIVLSTVLFLLAARVWLVRRAFGSARNLLIPFFGALDRIYTRWNTRLGGIVLWQEQSALPDDDPVAWRELQKRALGRWHHLVRLCLLIEVPVLLVGSLCTGGSEDGPMQVLTMAMWILTALTLIVQGANAIVAERTRQTLDVLLVTPMAAGDIVRQKMRALTRLWVVLAIPLLSLAFLTFWGPFWRVNAWMRLAGELLAIGVFSPLLLWGSLWIGLKVKTRFRTIMTALLALVAWCVVPPAVLLVAALVMGHRLEGDILLLFSPAAMLSLTEFDGWRDIFHDAAWIVMISSFVVYGGIAYAVRRLCLRNADWYLRKEKQAR